MIIYFNAGNNQNFEVGKTFASSPQTFWFEVSRKFALSSANVLEILFKVDRTFSLRLAKNLLNCPQKNVLRFAKNLPSVLRKFLLNYTENFIQMGIPLFIFLNFWIRFFCFFSSFSYFLQNLEWHNNPCSKKLPSIVQQRFSPSHKT